MAFFRRGAIIPVGCNHYPTIEHYGSGAMIIVRWEYAIADLSPLIAPGASSGSLKKIAITFGSRMACGI
jgi:hypothetical protein